MWNFVIRVISLKYKSFFVFLLLPLTAFPSQRATQAATVPTIQFDDVSIKPYATEQLDIGGFGQTRQPVPGVGVRAGRLRNGARVTIHNQIELGGIWDFGPAPGGQMRLFEGQASYVGLKHFVFTVGIFKPSFGLESMQAQGDTTFIERSSISTITRNIAAGIERQAVQIEAHGQRYHVAISGTAGTAGPGENGNQRALVFRLVGVPMRTKDLFIHLGFSGEWVFKAAHSPGEKPSMAFSDYPEMNVGLTSKYLNTNRLTLNNVGAFGLEAAAAWKRGLLQGEAYDIVVQRAVEDEARHLHFSGWYTQASYTLVGQPRSWKSRSAAFSSPVCDKKQDALCHGSGVLEAAVRYSAANLHSGSIDGGRQQAWSATFNWWPIDILKIALQYEYGKIQGGKTPENFHAVLSMIQIKF